MTAASKRRVRWVLVVATARASGIVSNGSFRVTASGVIYAVTDFGSLGCCASWNWDSIAYGINNAGDIAGASTSPNDHSVIVPFTIETAR